MTAAPSVSDFHPPYHLGAFGCALVGTWEGAPEPSRDAGGFEPLRWLGRPLGAALVLRYDRPPPDHPVAYTEVVLAHLVRRGLELAVLPFHLVLDDAFFVEAGVRHYHLPKTLDASLRLEVARGARGAPTSVSASAADLAFTGRLRRAVPGATLLASTLTRAFTGRVSVIGAARTPPLRSVIRVAPDAGPAYAVCGATLASGGCKLATFAALYWPSLAVTVGAPEPL